MIFDLNEITIEHIYPQNSQNPVDALEGWKHNIGNLAFWGRNDNQAAGNSPFSVKRRLYAKSTVKLTNELSTLSKWDDQGLTKRQDRLIKMATKIFSA